MNENRTTVTESKDSNENERKKYFLMVEDYADFDSAGEIEIGTTNALAVAINALFAPAFDDYYGCTLTCGYVNNVLTIIPFLYFRILPDKEYKKDRPYGFKSISSAGATIPIIERLTRMTTPGVSPLNTSVMITQDAIDVFEEFVPKYGNTQIKWDNNYVVKQIGGNELFAYVKNVDLVQIIKKMKGTQDSEGKPCSYMVNPVMPITTNMQFNPNMMVYPNAAYPYPYMAQPQNETPQNWVINILKLNEGALNRAMEAAGIMMNTSNPFPVVQAVREK